MDQLREALGTIPQGKLVEADARKIEAALSGCWDDLAAHEGGMKVGKLLGRTEEMEWNRPLLIFKIERHGGFVGGSGRAEIQHWEVDVESCAATLMGIGKRQMFAMDARLDVKSLAAEIAAIIDEGRDDHRMIRRGNEVRIITAEVIPAANKQTTTGRRRRFVAAIEPLLAQFGWCRRAAGSHLIFERRPDGPKDARFAPPTTGC